MKILHVAILFTLVFSGLALFFSIPKGSHIQDCLLFQYNIQSIKSQIKGEMQTGIMSTSRMICINVNKEDPLL